MLPSPPHLKPVYVDSVDGIRETFLAGVLLLLFSLFIWLFESSLPGFLPKLFSLALSAGITLIVIASLQYIFIVQSQFRLRDSILEKLDLQGHEQVLEVGCGRGLLLLGIAKVLTTGRAIGIDTWQEGSPSGTAITITEENARREGVAEKVELHTGTLYPLPFQDERFDAVMTSVFQAISLDTEDSMELVKELHRVLKPEGFLVLFTRSNPVPLQAILEHMGYHDIHMLKTRVLFMTTSYQLWARKPYANP